MSPRTRRVIVSGVLGGLLVLVIAAAVSGWLR